MAATAEKEPPTVATVPQAATVAGAEPGLSRAGCTFFTALLTVILLPFRVVLILVCLVVAWALANIGLYGLSKEDLRNKPLAGWRRQLRQLTALVMRALFLFGSFNYIRYKGVRASPKEAPVICVAPHTAFYDSVCVVLFGPSAVVAKYETASLPFFGSRLLHHAPICCRCCFVFILMLCLHHKNHPQRSHRRSMCVCLFARTNRTEPSI
uniref:Phospholipid/glycerol acyltransferase domain-containing protein n=1 Tax=Anopheles maculatus TaxID=74869 RepID=A0A182S657_9DIPT